MGESRPSSGQHGLFRLAQVAAQRDAPGHGAATPKRPRPSELKHSGYASESSHCLAVARSNTPSTIMDPIYQGPYTSEEPMCMSSRMGMPYHFTTTRN